MTRARREIIRPLRPGTFHLITRCVRRERLLDRGERKTWLCRGLASWLGHMGIDVLAYAIMGNHVHLVVRVRADVVGLWDNLTVARHALAVLPVRSGPGLEPLAVTTALVERYADDEEWLAEQRERLSSPSWLLRLVKQEIARRANAEDGCTGHFWERRFTSVVLLDQPAVLACMVYVDLNPIRAHLVREVQESSFTSIRHRFARAQGEGRADNDVPDAALGGRLTALPQCAPADTLTGSLTGWNISEKEYVALVLETAKLDGRASRVQLAQALQLVQRFDINPEAWLKTMQSSGAMSGSVIGGPAARRKWCEEAGQRWAADKSGLW
jgi:hypothetical protein